MSDTNTFSPRRRAFLIAIVASIGVAACGRRGPLEPPPGSAEARQVEEARAAQAEQAKNSPSLSGGRRRKPPPVTAPKDNPFFLDFLL